MQTKKIKSQINVTEKSSFVIMNASQWLHSKINIAPSLSFLSVMKLKQQQQLFQIPQQSSF